MTHIELHTINCPARKAMAMEGIR